MRGSSVALAMHGGQDSRARVGGRYTMLKSWKMISSGMPWLVSLATPSFLRVSSRSLQKGWLWSGEWKREKSRDMLVDCVGVDIG